LVVSGLVAAAGAWASLYYLAYRLGESNALKALQWEPLAVIASIWFVANLLVIYLLGRRGGVEASVVSPMLSEAAIADMHSDAEKKTEPVKSTQPKNVERNGKSRNNNKKERPEQPGKSKGSMKSEGPAKSDLSHKTGNSRKEKIKQEKIRQEKIAQEKNTRTTTNSKKKSQKKNGEAVTGIIKWFNGQKGYGFITSEEGEEVFVHCRSIKLGGKRQLHTGQQVSFTLLREDKGLKAEEVVILE